MMPLFWLWLQVKLGGISHMGLNTVLNFLYSGELLLDGGNIGDVLEAAHFLQVTIQLLISPTCLTVDLPHVQTKTPKTRPDSGEGDS